MKICFLADANSIHTHKLCAHLVARGHEVTVISLNDGQVPGATVHSLQLKVQSTHGGFTKVAYLKQVLRVRALVRQIDPDLVHAHYATSYGLLGALVNRHPYVLSVWGSDVYDFPLRSPLHRTVLTFNLSRADRVLSTSKAMAEQTALFTSKPITITPFGVDLERFQPSSATTADELVIGTVKGLERIYGFDLLVSAFARLVQAHPHLNLRLQFGGSGTVAEELAAQAHDLGLGDRVTFLGRLTPDQVPAAFNSFDIAVFPSVVNESFGVAAVEAQACGVPVVVSDVPGLLESTKAGETSLVARRGDVDDLTAQIDRLVTDPELRQTMGAAARAFVVEHYDVQKNFAVIDEVYRALVSAEGSQEAAADPGEV